MIRLICFRSSEVRVKPLFVCIYNMNVPLTMNSAPSLSTSKSESQETLFSDPDSHEPVAGYSGPVSKRVGGGSHLKGERSSDSSTVSRGRHAASAATLSQKKTRVTDSSSDPSPGARLLRSEVKLSGPAPRPYVLLLRRATSAVDRSPDPSTSVRLSRGEVESPAPRPHPCVLLPRPRVPDIE